MAKAAEELQCIARRGSAGSFSISPKQQDISFLSLFSSAATEEPVPAEDQPENAQISACRNYSRYTILSTLLGRHCDVRHGMLIHHYIILKQLESSPFLGSHLLHMYFRCKSPEDGFSLSANLSDLNVCSFNYLMEAYIEQREHRQSLELFDRMQEEAILPNKFTFLTILKALGEKPIGVHVSRVHVRIKNSDLGHDNVLGTALLRLYGEGYRMKDATELFNSMAEKDVISWTTMINLYAQEGQIGEAFHLYGQMQQQGSVPTMITFVSLLSVCAKHAALDEGAKLHALIVADSFNPDITLNNALVNMYGKCACLDDACSVFDKMLEKNVVTWTCMITLYTQKGYGKAALVLFNRMQAESVPPNRFSFVGAVVACSCVAVLDESKRIHTQLYESEGVDAIAGAALVNMYDKCGSLEDAVKVFNSIIARDLVLWNTMISAYAQSGKLSKALGLLESMQAQGMCPDKVTFSNIFNVCGDCGQKSHRECLHAYILESGLEPELIVGNSLAHMYAYCGDLEHARQVFDDLAERDVVSWTVMIAAYATHRQSEMAFNFFDQMQQQGLLPDKVTYISMLDSCCSSSSQSHYKRLHARLEKSGFVDTEVAVQNALITLFGKWGNLHDAERIFTAMAERDVVTWNALISLYSRHENVSKVFETLREMLNQNIRPNKVTLVSVVSACASQALFIEGKHMHAWAVDSGFHTDNILATAILTMYGKCGSIEDARRCFDLLHERNLLTWNAMMAVYSHHGQVKEAIDIFQQMQQERVVPDAMSFLALLIACNHAGLPDEGRKLFTIMVQDYGILPSADHCGCLINLFGRFGRLNEAETLLHSLPSQLERTPFATMLVGACNSNNDQVEESALQSILLNQTVAIQGTR